MLQYYLQNFSNNLKNFLDFLSLHLNVVNYIAVAGIFLFVLILLKLISSPRKEEELMAAANQDISAIAGDDQATSQLDLARAYIEMGNKPFAKQMLKQVIDNGNSAQQQEAKNLLASL